MSHYESWVYAAALAALPMQTPRRLRLLIDAGDVAETWQRVIAGESVIPHISPKLHNMWSQAPSSLLDDMCDACTRHHITVTTRSDSTYPTVLHGDPYAPAVLFSRGTLSALTKRRAGIVGTRHATRSGARMAFMLGAQLAAEDIAVVSGLARGIDVEAHAGVLSHATPRGAAIAVVASGIDVVYPPEHRNIWNRVAESGLVLSEAPPGTEPVPHRFPLRNRIIAALSEVLVVVESGHRGGSMITVREAMKRDVCVMAVPGSPGLRQSEGTTALLRDGCAPVGDVTDVLIALGLDTRREHRWCDTRQVPTHHEAAVLSVLAHKPRTLDEVALLGALSVVDAAILLGRLQAKQWVAHTDGWWEALLD